MAWHARPAEEVLAAFEVERPRGLDAAEVERRLEERGPNRLRAQARRSSWSILLEQFRSIVVWLLAIAAALAFATGRWPEGGAVLAVIAVNAAIGFFSEWRAVRSMAALRELTEHETRVRREGEERRIAAADLVPGDVVLLAAGELVPADLRICTAERLRVNEAALTGESVPADKTEEAVAEDTGLADRTCMLHRGTSVVDGNTEGVVVATGSATELGRIAELAEQAEANVPPLQKRLDGLGRRLAWITLCIAAAIAGLGLLVRGQDARLVIETALALGIAAIPEGLPILATIALARGMRRMAKRRALVNRLTAVETLGATQVIFSDKTGTLTENRIRLRKIATSDGDCTLEAKEDPLARRVVEAGVLCNGASLDSEVGEDQPRGDPTEMALLAGGREFGLERPALLERLPEVRVEEFDPKVRKMATFHRDEARLRVAVKGAPEAVLPLCVGVLTANGAEAGGDPEPLDDEGRRAWLERANGFADEGLRVLAIAEKHVEDEGAEAYSDLCLLGLAGLLDPAREGIKAVIDQCQAAGIRVEMVTGDQPRTARAIAGAVGIVGDADDPEAVVMKGDELGAHDRDEAHVERILRANLFARVSPEQKLELVEAYQQRGLVVAMTGDGINDAPALKKADIGIAMGRRGTEAAKQVADMVLEDDAFETIVAAIAQGRVIFVNIRKSVMFMLCTNVAEVLAVAVAALASLTLPLLPLQILYLNVITDVLPALALGVGPGSGNEMQEPPRASNEGILTRSHWLEILLLASVIASCVLGSLLLAEGPFALDERQVVTVSFLTLAFGKLWFTFALRSPRSGLLKNEITRNPWIWASILACILLLIAAVHVPFLADLLQTRDPGGTGWGLLLGMSVLPLLVGQVLRGVQRRRQQTRDGDSHSSSRGTTR